MNIKFGEKFKQIRKQKGMSLDAASRDITSKSSLYYWEKGQANMSFEKVIAMLERMRIKPSEFVTDSLNDNIDYQKIVSAYLTDNDKKLQSLASIYLKASQKKPYNRTLLLRAAVACSFLKSDTGQNLFMPRDTKRLEELLSEIKDWRYEDLFNFGNTLFLLPGKRIIGLAQMLIQKYQKNTDDIVHNISWRHETVTTLNNAALVLLFKNSVYAKKLITELNNIKIDDDLAYEKIRLEFGNECILYTQTKDDQNINKIFFPALSYLGLNKLRSSLEKSFLQLKAIYN